MENHHAINGNTHYKWPFSIAILNNQRVCHESLKFLVTSWLDCFFFHGIPVGDDGEGWMIDLCFPLSVRALPQWLCWVVWQQITMAVRQPSPLQMARRSSVLAEITGKNMWNYWSEKYDQITIFFLWASYSSSQTVDITRGYQPFRIIYISNTPKRWSSDTLFKSTLWLWLT